MTAGPTTLEDGIDTAERKGYTQPGDRWVTPQGETLPEGADPKPVQVGAIREGFRAAADQNDFDVFSIDGVNKRIIDESRPTTRNIQDVFQAFQKTVSEDLAEEVADQLQQAGHDLEAGQTDG